jgi:hypothetical protein
VTCKQCEEQVVSTFDGICKRCRRNNADTKAHIELMVEQNALLLRIANELEAMRLKPPWNSKARPQPKSSNGSRPEWETGKCEDGQIFPGGKAVNLTFLRRIHQATHFRLDNRVYSRTDTGEWFLEYAPGVWQPLLQGDTDALETLYEELPVMDKTNEHDLPF